MEFDYDQLRRLTAVRPPRTNPVTTTYDDQAGRSVAVSRGSSASDRSVVTTTLDGFGRPVRTENSVGIKTRTEYDFSGRLVYQSYPFTGDFRSANDIGVQTRYDRLGRVHRLEHPDGSVRIFTYGAGTVTIVDEELRQTVHTVEAFANPAEALLVSVRDAEGELWRYTYTGLGKLAQVQAPDGVTRTWTYQEPDGARSDRVKTETHPESGTTEYWYDDRGNLRQRRDARQQVFVQRLDGNDRLRAISLGDEVITNITYEPGTDNRESMVSGRLSTTFQYEPTTGRLSSRTDVVEDLSFRSQFTYDNNDNLETLSYPSGRRVRFEYDSERRLRRVVDDTAPNRVYARDFEYHPSGAVARYWTGNGLEHVFTYDQQRYWLRSIRSGALSLSYEDYDRVGNVRRIVDSRPEHSQTLTYDDLDRLESATGGLWSIQYRHDVHGNRRTWHGTTYEYWPGTLRLREQSTGTFTRSFDYDANGNLTQSQGTTYAYTPYNLLASTAGAGIGSAFVYDADNWRMMKRSGPETTVYLRGQNNELLTEWTNPGTTPRTFRDYIYARARLIAVVQQP